MIQIIRQTPTERRITAPKGQALYEVDHGFVVLES